MILKPIDSSTQSYSLMKTCRINLAFPSYIAIFNFEVKAENGVSFSSYSQYNLSTDEANWIQKDALSNEHQACLFLKVFSQLTWNGSKVIDILSYSKRYNQINYFTN